MTQDQFIGRLKDEEYSFFIKKGKIIVDAYKDYSPFVNIKSLPPNVVFKNKGIVDLSQVQEIPPGTEFKNTGYVDLQKIKSIPPGTVFENDGSLYLEGLEVLDKDVRFNNKGDVHLDSLTSIPRDFQFTNEKNIYVPKIGIGETVRVGQEFYEPYAISNAGSRSLLNLMIRRGIFE